MAVLMFVCEHDCS